MKNDIKSQLPVRNNTEYLARAFMNSFQVNDLEVKYGPRQPSLVRCAGVVEVVLCLFNSVIVTGWGYDVI